MTPSKISTTRILINKVRELGRRDSRIYIFKPEEKYPYILLNIRLAVTV